MERHEAYKDSGVEWIGDIPAGWEANRLKYMASNRVIPADSKAGRYLGLEQVQSWTMTIADETDETDTAGILYDEACVLFGKLRPYLAKVALPNSSGPCSSEFLVLQPLTINRTYLAYALVNELFINAVNAMTYGVRMPRAGWDLVGNLQLPVPPNYEQECIADYLDAKTAEIDGLVADCEREVGLLQEYRKAVISEAVTKGLDSDAPMRDSGIEWIGEIPEGWGLPRLGMLLSGMKDGTHSTHARVDDGHPLLSAKNVRETCINISDHESMIAEEDYQTIIACGYPRMGDVLLTTIGGSIGRSVVYTLTEVHAFQRSVMFLRPMQTLLDSRYLCYMLRSNLMQRQMFERAAASAQDGIYSGDIARYKAVLPPLHEQASIADYLDAKTAEIDSLIEAKQAMADKLREYRRSLISEAVTGKFKVPGV